MNSAGKSKILFVLPSLCGGGAERVTLNLVKGLYERNKLVELLVFDFSGPLVSEIPAGIRVHDLKTNSLRHSLIPMIRLIRLIKPNIVFSTLGYVNIAILFVRPLLNTGVSIWIREANLPSISLRNNPYFIIFWIGYRLIYQTANKILCTSERMREEMILNFKIPKRKIFLLHNPVDKNKIRKLSLTPKSISNIGRNFISVGSLTYQKGFDRVILWFSIIANKDDNLLILGSGELKDELIDIARNLDITNQVVFMEFCANPWEWISGADVLLLPSRWEGMPNVALESLACGTPIISTYDAGGILEVQKQVKPQSVIIALTENEFIDAMTKVNSDLSLYNKESLLPRCYEINRVISKFERMF